MFYALSTARRRRLRLRQSRRQPPPAASRQPPAASRRPPAVRTIVFRKLLASYPVSFSLSLFPGFFFPAFHFCVYPPHPPFPPPFLSLASPSFSVCTSRTSPSLSFSWPRFFGGKATLSLSLFLSCFLSPLPRPPSKNIRLRPSFPFLSSSPFTSSSLATSPLQFPSSPSSLPSSFSSSLLPPKFFSSASERGNGRQNANDHGREIGGHGGEWTD